MQNTHPSTVELDFGGYYERSTDTIYCCHSAGFFSNVTVSLWHLAQLYEREQKYPARINFSNSFDSFRNASDAAQKTDLYDRFFSLSKQATAHLSPTVGRIDHHGLYRLIDYDRYRPIINHYFGPSAEVNDFADQLVRKYQLDLSKTIAVVYRGTDKGTEVWLASPEAFLNRASKLLDALPDYKVWIQTDEADVRDLFVQTFGDRCFYLDEMPVSQNKTVLHMQDETVLQSDRTHFGIKLVAVTLLLSRAAYLINHTGNMALWICLFRGHAKQTTQFDRNGEFDGLRGLDYVRFKGRNLFKTISRKLGRRS